MTFDERMEGTDEQDFLRTALASIPRTDGRWLGQTDFAVLRTLMLLAAVDGVVSRDEWDCFRSILGEYRDGVNGLTRETLWESALHGAGYLVLQSQLLSRDDLIEAFADEAGTDFAGEMAVGSDDERRAAFSLLKRMAHADGAFSDLERDCIRALERRIAEERHRVHMHRYPHGIL